jgi:hypothetical protein
MAAPAGLSSGSVPEPVAEATAEPEATEPEAAAEPEVVEAEVAEPEATGPEPELGAAEPEVAEAQSELEAEAELEAEGAPESRESRGRRVVAVVSVVAGVIVLVATAVAALAVVTHGFRPKTVVTYRPQPAVFGLRAGECINSSPNGLSVTIKSCATPHDAEVFATFRLAGSSWPGDTVIRQEASSGCATRVAAYLNPQLANAGLAQEYVFPDRQAWQAGVRTVVCEISASSGQLSGSVRQPG